MRRIHAAVLVLVSLGLLCGAAPAVATVTPRESVVLLHGLGRGEWAMRPLARRLDQAGYDAHVVVYPSTSMGMDGLVRHLADAVAQCCAGAPRLHFVTHSMGGILARAYLADTPPPNLGRVVMLSPPNGGTEIVDRLGDWRAFRWFFGPVAPQLGTAPDSLPNRLGPVRYEVGVITGDRIISPAGWLLIPGPSDGTVSIESAGRLAGLRDFIVMPHTHTFIMWREPVAKEVMHFLRTGAFSAGARRHRAAEVVGGRQPPSR
jgi:pimeloyl-ACP methyl ester carboxylesterase